MSVLRVLTSAGDTVLEWNPKDAESVAEVKAEFDGLTSSGFLAFRVDSPTEGEQIKKFDPDAQTVIMSIPLMGG